MNLFKKNIETKQIMLKKASNSTDKKQNHLNDVNILKKKFTSSLKSNLWKTLKLMKQIERLILN